MEGLFLTGPTPSSYYCLHHNYNSHTYTWVDSLSHHPTAGKKVNEEDQNKGSVQVIVDSDDDYSDDDDSDDDGSDV